MKVVIPGGSGQVGTLLARAFHAEGHDVVVLSRRPTRQPWRVTAWDGATAGPWQRDVDGSDVVINLAGRSVNCRYNDAHRAEILRSRVDSTRAVGEAIQRATVAPRVWLQASTATIYAHRFDQANDEHTGVVGGAEAAPSSWRFSIEVARAWEQSFDESITNRTRKVAMRSAMTLSPDPGGVFDTLAGLARYGLGGRAGDGRQFVSWVHEVDFVNAVRYLILRDDICGAVNIATPNPIPNEEFMRVLREECKAPFGVNASRWMLEIGALMMRTETELILKSRRVVPGRLLEAGFEFRYPQWREAARELCRRWRQTDSESVAA
ncbi:MAG TPA: TIGR01777 family oxidoreductase [Vicinamibacterales bacterium]|nr:TIGR01777 family oxidoreductase [Vicinamibacterales bacterium]